MSNNQAAEIKVGLIGAGRIGQNHAAILARHTPGARLVAIADPAPGVAQRLVDALGVPDACTEAAEL
jgi:myo-inositol 2-dehydrogenase/D-chiro-inositol 1-dehydrogenase